MTPQDMSDLIDGLFKQLDLTIDSVRSAHDDRLDELTNDQFLFAVRWLAGETGDQPSYAPDTVRPEVATSQRRPRPELGPDEAAEKLAKFEEAFEALEAEDVQRSSVEIDEGVTLYG